MTRGGILSSTKGFVISAPFHWPPKRFLCCAAPLPNVMSKDLSRLGHKNRRSMKVAIQLATTASPKIGRESLSFAGCFAIAAYAKGLKRPAGEARDTQQRAQTLW